MRYARILSMSFFAAGIIGAASASANDPFSIGDAYPGVGEEVWRFVPSRAGASSTTRAQVVAELREAQRLGQISVGEEVWRLADWPSGPSKSRAQVVAELREAQRLGLVNVGGEGDVRVATAEQERLITFAGLRALEEPAIAKR